MESKKTTDSTTGVTKVTLGNFQTEITELCKKSGASVAVIEHVEKKVKDIENSLNIFQRKSHEWNCPNHKFVTKVIAATLCATPSTNLVNDLFDPNKTAKTLSTEKMNRRSADDRKILNQHLTAVKSQLGCLTKKLQVASISDPFTSKKIAAASSIVEEFKSRNFNEFQEQKEAMLTALTSILKTELPYTDAVTPASTSSGF